MALDEHLLICCVALTRLMGARRSGTKFQRYRAHARIELDPATRGALARSCVPQAIDQAGMSPTVGACQQGRGP